MFFYSHVVSLEIGIYSSNINFLFVLHDKGGSIHLLPWCRKVGGRASIFLHWWKFMLKFFLVLDYQNSYLLYKIIEIMNIVGGLWRRCQRFVLMFFCRVSSQFCLHLAPCSNKQLLPKSTEPYISTDNILETWLVRKVKGELIKDLA